MAVIQLQTDFDDCRTEFELARKHTPAVTLQAQRQSGFTSTPVPRHSGKSNWEQYREVFEAIVCSNGWDDVTAALQLLSHLDGDALNVALLVPESRRVVPGFLIKSFIRSLQLSRTSGGIQASVSAGVPAPGGWSVDLFYWTRNASSECVYCTIQGSYYHIWGIWEAPPKWVRKAFCICLVGHNTFGMCLGQSWRHLQSL